MLRGSTIIEPLQTLNGIKFRTLQRQLVKPRYVLTHLASLSWTWLGDWTETGSKLEIKIWFLYLGSVLNYNEILHFEKIMHYTHPRQDKVLILSVNSPCVLEKDVYSVHVGYSITKGASLAITWMIWQLSRCMLLVFSKV